MGKLKASCKIQDAWLEDFKGIAYNEIENHTQRGCSSVPSENQMELAWHRLGKARQCAATARNILFDGDYEASVDRSYFAFFHGMRAVMALDGLEVKEESSLTKKFVARYVQTGIFDKHFSETIKAAFELNFVCIYEDFLTVPRREAEQQEQSACAFLEAVEQYIKSQMQS